MNTNSDYSQFPRSMINTGWVVGYGVVRVSPWDFVGLYRTEAEAANARDQLGGEYVAKFGEHRLGTDDFIFS